ncbi:dihydropteroate synthase [Planctomycetaceae bacterium SH139]
MRTPTYADHWQLRTRTMQFGSQPVVMGILNVTPDSFSDGGRYAGTKQAVDEALRMEDAGAGIIDVGGESTRPYSDPVAESEELERVMPVVEALTQRLSIPLSIDTSKAAVAAAAVSAGAEIINDVTGLSGDPQMLAVAVDSGVGICAMHMQGTPQTMQNQPTYQDVVAEIASYLRERLHACQVAGIATAKICLDPGIGFGKTHAQNIELLRGMEHFLAIGQPLLVGHSRKGFIAHVLADKTTNRLAGTLGVSLALASSGVQVLRVHDVAETVQALKLYTVCQVE